MFNDLSSPANLIATRRSGKPRDMVQPGPSDAQLNAILTAATRVPDHGKLAPWRFVVIGSDQRDALSDMMTQSYRAEKPEAGRLEIEAIDQFSRQAPSLIVGISSPKRESHIPLWEQELSVGAACMQLLNAAHAQGFVGSWLTGWPTYSPNVAKAFCREGERIAAYLFIGSSSRPLDERPRPDLASVISHWTPPA